MPGSAVEHIGYGQTNGSPQPLLVSSASNTNGYTGSGNLEPGDPGAVTIGGPNGNGGGGQGPTGGGAVDGIYCNPSMSELYHVHFFLGVYDNGTQVAVPAGVGMVNPNQPNQDVYDDELYTPAPGATVPPGTVPNQTWTANCYYDLHVHDKSGMIHIETSSNGQCGAFTYYPATPSPSENVKPCNYESPFTLQTFFDVWGISIGANNFGPLKGPVQIYTTPPGYDSYTACGTTSQGYVVTPCETTSNEYQLVSGNPATIPATIQLQSHTTVWIVIGSPPSSGLPNIAWDEGDP